MLFWGSILLIDCFERGLPIENWNLRILPETSCWANWDLTLSILDYCVADDLLIVSGLRVYSIFFVHYDEISRLTTIIWEFILVMFDRMAHELLGFFVFGIKGKCAIMLIFLEWPSLSKEKINCTALQTKLSIILREGYRLIA